MPGKLLTEQGLQLAVSAEKARITSIDGLKFDDKNNSTQSKSLRGIILKVKNGEYAVHLAE